MKFDTGILFAGFIALIPISGVCVDNLKADTNNMKDRGGDVDFNAESESSAPVISDREWNTSAKLWIARAMVSEAGWNETTDHVAIAYVLYRRWIQVRRKYPKFPIRGVVMRYCAGFGKTVYSTRQKWVKNLEEDGTRPKGWPSDISWNDYKDRWLAVLNTAEEWKQGLHPDPCGGISRYWGGPMDKPSKRMVRMNCGKTRNYFYTVRNLLPKAELTDSDSK
jgi:hypothetical protein